MTSPNGSTCASGTATNTKTYHLVNALRAEVPSLTDRAGNVPEPPPQFNLSGAKAVQIGNRNDQHNQFS